MRNTSQSTVNFLSGTAGGVAQVLVGHPFDTLKVGCSVGWAFITL